MPTATEVHDLTKQEYELFRRLVYDHTGINLGDAKQQLVRSRLGKRLRQGGFGSYRAYYEHIKRDTTGKELGELVDAISTNTTHLFREQQHFEFLGGVLGKLLDDRKWRAINRELRVWSAGCSSGDEPYSIAMTVDDALGTNLGWRLLATDISTQILEKAKAGIYEPHRLGTVPPEYKRRYLVRAAGDQGHMQMSPTLRSKITFARLNLMDDRFPFRQGFHFIFCRNVMIYFDPPTQETLVAKYTAHLQPGGYLLIGHSESLSNIQHTLKYVRPTVYQKPEA